MDLANINPLPQFFRVFVSLMTIILLVINIAKEIFQMINEGKEYFTQFENVVDMIVYALVSIC